jgi:antitoxin (DNA-binding transcriptional repressor) of toxin-antitoxin stability system
MPTTVTIHKAKTQLSKLIARAEAGEEIIIARGKHPIVTLALVAKPPRRKFGAFKGQLPELPDAFFFDPLPDEELKAWEGDDENPFR